MPTHILGGEGGGSAKNLRPEGRSQPSKMGGMMTPHLGDRKTSNPEGVCPKNPFVLDQDRTLGYDIEDIHTNFFRSVVL